MLSYQTFITFPNLSILTLCLLYQFLSLYQSFVVLSNFCHLFAPCYLFTFYVIFSSYKFTYCTHNPHNSLSCLIVRTLSAPIYLSNPPGVFGHRAILLWGGSRHGWGFSLRISVTLYVSCQMSKRGKGRGGMPIFKRKVHEVTPVHLLS